jgi:hypothetical protein
MEERCMEIFQTLENQPVPLDDLQRNIDWDL